MLKNMAARLVALALGFVVMVAILPGVHRTSAGGIFWSALVYMVINATAGRILKFVTAPLALLTLGLSILAINLGVLAITVMIVDNLEIDGFWTWVWAAVILSAVSFIANYVLRRDR
ncbi:MAG TPA: phage holin family protein [Acidimicrobiales bacterium]|nr:phage holin family protein [Acidimicrobiales bacterium]